MRKQILAVFLAAAFLLYWLNTVDLPTGDGEFSFGTIKPIITRIIDSTPEPTPAQPIPAPAAKREVAASKPLSLEAWLLEESVRVGQVDPNPNQTFIRLKDRASRLDHRDLRNLKRLALEKSLNSDARFLAVYMLGLAQQIGAQALLKEVCFAQIPEKATDREHSDEVILRAQSLETLVQRMSPREARSMLRELLSRTSDPILARQAQYWLSKLG